MHRGWVYVLLFAFPALLVSGIAAIALFGAAAGTLWLFAFGDNPWPKAAETALGVGFGVAWLLFWLVLLVVAYLRGKRRPAGGAPLARRDMLAAIGVTIGAAGMIVLHQWSVGNLGAPSDGERCSTFCQRKGFSGSGMPPRNTGLATCSCVDGSGREALTVPLAETSPGSR